MKKGPFTPVVHKTKALFGSTPVLDASFPERKADRLYDKRWAYALSALSGWAYAKGQEFADAIQYQGFSRATVTQLRVSNPAMLVVATAYFVQTENKRVGALVFRGTEPASLINWLTDANTSKYPFQKDGGLVHSGFYANVEALWSDIVEVVNAAIDEGLEELYISGHSLGGAMAVVAAARIFDGGDDAALYSRWRAALRGVYTYGQPIVGDGDFKKKFAPLFGDFLFRHVYDHDVVPCLPPTSVDETFEHFGQRFYAANAKGVWERMDKMPDPRADLLVLWDIAASFLTHRIDAFAGIDPKFSLDDHFPRGYMDVSRNALKPEKERATPLQPARASVVERALWKAMHVGRVMRSSRESERPSASHPN